MPIAHCIVQADCVSGTEDVVALWTQQSGVSSEHMTVNLVQAQHQFGKAYKVMATLYLPSLWSRDKVDDLQLGLAKALADYFSIELSDVHVITTIVVSGNVVESGEIERW
ncbi:hypothetical protein [Aurantivibrio plasticivorans]